LFELGSHSELLERSDSIRFNSIDVSLNVDYPRHDISLEGCRPKVPGQVDQSKGGRRFLTDIAVYLVISSELDGKLIQN
jgi:hypothetical protein